jgi:hypothetical protein
VRGSACSYTRSEMGYRFEFDAANELLVCRFEGQLTDELLADAYRAVRKYSTVTGARAGIWDLSLVDEFAVSSDFIRQLAKQEPAMGDASNRPGVIVASDTVGFGLSRMFQLIGEQSRPLLHVVRTFNQALAELDVRSPDFQPLD